MRLTRLLGTHDLPDLDPFLMLDRFHSDRPDDYLAGFPEHPHRGFETVTIMQEGRMRHRDSTGNEGVIGPGGVQWMTAGRGILHSEMPEQEDGLLAGFQLWINLPAAQKMTRPGYQEFDKAGIPVEVREGARIRVIAGSTQAGTTGPARAVTEPLLLDITLKPGAAFRETVPDGHATFAAIYEGAVAVVSSTGSSHTVSAPEVAVFSEKGSIALNAGDQGARLILAAARPLNEPIARHGPFVMNSEAELRQAVLDIQSGSFAT